MKPTEIATLAIAILGAVLGVINTWQSVNRDRVRLRVSMRLAFPMPAASDWENHPHLSIEVINQSPFHLTISQVGVRQNALPSEMYLFNPFMPDGGTLPRRMEPRSSFTAYFALGPNMSFLRNVTSVYARTDAGKTAYSSRRESARVVKQVVSFLPVIDESQHGD